MYQCKLFCFLFLCFPNKWHENVHKMQKLNHVYIACEYVCILHYPGPEKQAVLPLAESVVCLPVYTCCAELPAPVQQAQTGRQMAARLTGHIM